MIANIAFSILVLSVFGVLVSIPYIPPGRIVNWADHLGILCAIVGIFAATIGTIAAIWGV